LGAAAGAGNACCGGGLKGRDKRGGGGNVMCMEMREHQERREEPEAKKPSVVALSANKGGVGKTRYVLLLANCLGSSGKKVLVIDMDFNNSATFYYLSDLSPDAEREIINKNIADAMAKEENNLDDYSILTSHRGVSLIASSRGLADLRSVNEKRLLRMLPGLRGLYDFVIIDCAPNYDNLVLNAINGSDVIITPVLKDMDSFNAAAFLQKKINVETEKGNAWFVTVNGYDRQYEHAVSGKQRDYVQMYQESFSGHITPSESWLPWTADMNEIKDRRKALSNEPVKGAVYNPGLYRAVVSLAGMLIEEDELPWAGVF
jgi:chromosome partitioning protein